MNLIEYLMTKIEEIKHIYYISDGSAAQYKNFKNFINLCLHGGLWQQCRMEFLLEQAMENLLVMELEEQLIG